MYLSYKKEPTRSYLVQQINEKKEKGLMDKNKKITENMLIDESFKFWLSLNEKDYVKRIFNYPSLTIDDHKALQEIVNETKYNQAIMSFATFGISMLFYRVFLRKISLFYNFFNTSHMKPLQYAKKGISCFTFYWLQLFGLNYIYDHRIPILIRDKGYFKKYNIDFHL